MSNYLFCIVVVEKNVVLIVIYNLFVCDLSMCDFYDIFIFVNNFDSLVFKI